MAGTTDLTKNQTVVFQTLKSSRRPLSAYEILEQKGVRSKGITAPVTVYRALDKLLEKGLIHRIESLNAFVACHDGPHLQAVAFVICNTCRRTLEVPAANCASLLTAQAAETGFDVAHIKIELSGLCRDCRTA